MSTPSFQHRPPPFDWQVMLYGGDNPRTGFAQPPFEMQFPVRRHGFGYTLQRVLWRANDFAKAEHRTHFALRAPDGAVVYDGPALNEIEAPDAFARLSDAELVRLSRGQRQFERDAA